MREERIVNTKLPSGPCLVIEWTPYEGAEEGACGRFEWLATYSLRLPLKDGDIRTESKNYREGYQYIHMGETKSGGAPPDLYEGLHIPFRDGVHIMRDANVLKLPAFVVCGDKVQQIDTRMGGAEI